MSKIEVIQKTCVQIYKDCDYHGSGVLVKVNGVFYVLSAAHVYSQDQNEPIDLKGFYGKSEKYDHIDFKELIGDSSVHFKHDVAVVSVQENGSFHDFPDIDFCTDLDFPENSFVFRGTQKSSELKPHSVNPCYLDTPANCDQLFCLKVPLECYSDTIGNVGAEVLRGYSGSGVFVKDACRNYLVGIVLNVDKDDFVGVNCRSVQVIKDCFLPNLAISEFHGGNAQLKLNVAQIKREITKELIEERKNNAYGDVENLTRKMDFFLKDWKPEDLDRFISDILTWENIEHKKIRNYSVYRDCIDNAKAIWEAGNKQYLVNDAQQGNERFHKIRDELVEILKEELDGTTIKTSSNVIAAGEVARLLANCDLDFKG